MAKIKKTIDSENKITIYSVSGEFLFDQIIDLVKQYYLEELTLNVIFDLTNADMSAITTDEMERIVEFSKEYAHLREGGKTAFITSGDLGFGLSRMYSAYAEVKGHPIAQRSFRNFDEAMTWIKEENR